MAKLGINIDHVATVREVRGTLYPDPVSAAKLAELGGADAIVCHLREDRRHIQDHDVITLRKSIDTKLTLEMAATDEMINIALKIKPDTACFVPEKRDGFTKRERERAVQRASKKRKKQPQKHARKTQASKNGGKFI